MKRLTLAGLGVLVLVLALAVSGRLLGPRPAHAEQVQRIAAIVNDEVISVYDLVSRLRMVMVSSRLPDSPENRRRLVPQILQGLINEQLQIQEAKRLNLKVTDKELQEAIANLAQQNNVAPGEFGEFLRSAGLEIATVVAQVRANFAWQKVVAQRIRPRLRVSDEEVDEVLRRISLNQGSRQYQISEIFLSVDSPDQGQSVSDTAERLTKQIRDGADFGSLAKQFSQSGSASSNGDVGWVQRGQILEELEEVLERMGPGDVSDPIRTRTGFYILLLRKHRTLAAKPPEEISVTLSQINLKHPENATADDLIAQKELAETISNTAQGCEDMVRLSKELGVTSSAGSIKVKVKELAEELRETALTLEVGSPSSPISKKDGIAVVMVCERDERADLPDRNQIHQSLGRERLDVMVRRYLRDLRLGAFLEVRV